MGQDPDWEKCPPEIEDFPELVVDIVSIYNSLGDRIYPDIGYIGKDFTNLNYLLKRYKVKEYMQDFVFDTILQLDSRKIEASQKRIKAEYDKIKNKHGR
tara:strand:- start:8700 stop:8996 length:297 start_codon:yes stop_codon:yes gene_type:complete